MPCTYFIRLTPKCFTFLNDLEGIIFLISMSMCSLLVFINTVGF